MNKITISSGKTFEVTKIDKAIIAHYIVDDGAVFVAMLFGDFFKAEIQYFSCEGALIRHSSEDVCNFLTNNEVEEIENELKKSI